MRGALTSEVRAIETDIAAQLSDARKRLSGLAPLLREPSRRQAVELTRSGGELRRRSRETDLRLVTLSATQAPVACDLRLVLTLMQVAQHLGMIANQFVLIGEQLAELDPAGTDRCGTTEKVLELAELACAQLECVASAFARRDPGACDKVRLGDQRLNRLNREVCRLSLEMAVGPDQRALAFRHVLIARSLERIGDNAVNIARQTDELVKADVHGLAHPDAATAVTAS